MRGPIEYYIDSRSEQNGGPTSAQELADSDIYEADLIEKTGTIIAGAGGFVTAISVFLIADPLSVEVKESAVNNLLVRETIESAITFGMKAPFAVTAGMGVAVFAEGLSIRRRARKRGRELEQDSQDAV